MATRRYFIGGESTADAAITVSVDGVQVYSGPVQPGDPNLDYRDDAPNVFTWSKDSSPRLAIVEFDTPNFSATTVDMTIRCDAGDIAITDIWPVGYVRSNPALTNEERAYLGDIAEESIPQEIRDSVAAKGGWRVSNPDLMYFPSPYTDIRTQVKTNGLAPSTDPEALPRCVVDASAGDSVSMVLTLPAQQTADRFTMQEEAETMRTLAQENNIANMALYETLTPIT
jgi:hypothetical protein